MTKLDCGLVRQWSDGDIIYVENDFCRMAYVYTDDPQKDGTEDWYGPEQIRVTYVMKEQEKHQEKSEDGVEPEVRRIVDKLRRGKGISKKDLKYWERRKHNMFKLAQLR